MKLPNCFKPKPVDALLREQLYEARVRMNEHTSAAEYHDALATMYRGQIERLEDALGMDKVLTGLPKLEGAPC